MVKQMKVVEDKIPSPGTGTGASSHSESDERLGTLLSDGLSADGHSSGQCLSSEDIAVLVEGNLIGSERDRMMKHLAACDDCREIYLLAAELHDEENQKVQLIPDSTPQPKRNRFYRPLAMAASVMIAVFSLYIFYNVSGIPKNEGDLATFSDSNKTTSMKSDTAPGTGQPAETDDAFGFDRTRKKRGFKSSTPGSPTPRKGGHFSKAGKKAGKAAETENVSPADKSKLKSLGNVGQSKEEKPPVLKNVAEAEERPAALSSNTFETENPKELSENRFDVEKPAPRSKPADTKKKNKQKKEEVKKKEDVLKESIGKNLFKRENKDGRVEIAGNLKVAESEDRDQGVSTVGVREKQSQSTAKPKKKNYSPTQQIRLQQTQMQQQRLEELKRQKGQEQKKQDQSLSQTRMISQDNQVGAAQGGVLNQKLAVKLTPGLRIKQMNEAARIQPGYMTTPNLRSMFGELLVLTRKLKETPGEYDGEVAELKPLVHLIKTSDEIYAFPDINYFLSRSAPGSTEHEFFTLARSGWCRADGTCYSSGGTAVGWNIGKDSAKNVLLKQWRELLPKLAGPYKDIAGYTIKHLEK